MKLWEVAKSLYEIRKRQTTEALYFHKWAEVTTAHGFLDLSRAKTLHGRLIWIFLIAISWIFMCYQVANSVKDFAGHEWASTVKEKASDLEGLPFPSVVICNVNRLKWSKVQEYDMSMELAGFVFSQLFLGQLNSVHTTAPILVDEFIKWRKEQNMSYIRMFDVLGPKCEDIFFTVICNSSYFTVTPVETYEYGRCWNLEFKSTAVLVGSKGGFPLFLDTQGWDYIPLVENNYIYQGLMLQLTYNGRVEIGQWIKLYPATHTTVSMQAFETDVRQEEGSILNPFALLQSSPPCERNPHLSYSNASLYSAATCVLECQLAIFIVNQCKCVPYMQNDRIPTCEIDEIYSCMNSEAAVNQTEEFATKAQECFKYCPPPCFSKYVKTQVSMTILPSANQREELQKWLNENDLQRVKMNDIILVEIFFTSLATQVIERYEVMSLDNLVSSSGGLIGLWAGMSFLTVFQAIAFFIEYVETRRKHVVKKLTKDRQKTQENNE